MSTDPPVASTVQDGSDFSIVRVLLTLLVIAIVGGAGTAAWWYVTSQEPKLYPVTGVVYLDGEPMPGGLIMTRHVDDPKLLGALAPIGKDGRFELRTNLVPGAYGGEHKIMVIYNTETFPPIALIPEHYSNPAKTPFSVVVDADTHKSPLKLELTGGKEPPAPRPAGGPRYPTPGQDGGPEPGEDGGQPVEQDAARPDAGEEAGSRSAGGAEADGASRPE